MQTEVLPQVSSMYHCELLTPARLQEMWPQINPLFEVCCKEASKGEIMAIDIYTLALQDRAYVFVETLDGIVTVALALEIIPYSRMRIANIFALGGAKALGAKARYWKYIVEWLKANKIDAIDVSVDDRMLNLLTKRFGFELVYRQARLKLEPA